MAFHRQDVKHLDFPLEVQVRSQQGFKPELKPFQFVVMRWDENYVLTPVQLKDVGTFLVEQAERIQQEFKQDGTPEIDE